MYIFFLNKEYIFKLFHKKRKVAGELPATFRFLI